MPPRKNNQKKFNKKRNFRKNRARVVETKRREAEFSSGIRNSTNGAGASFSANYPSIIKPTSLASHKVTLLPLRSFYRTSKGTRPDQMIGTEIFCKNIYAKGTVMGLPPTNAQECYVVAGWIRDRLGFTEFTTPTQMAATRTDLENFVLNQLKQHFDGDNEEMRYREKKLDNIKITHYRKLQHPKEAAYQDKVDFKVHWNVNRKVAYTNCTALAGGNDLVIQTVAGQPANTIDLTNVAKENVDDAGGDTAGYLPLNSHLPFLMLYTPEEPSPGSLTVSYNNITYFTG